MKKQKVYILEFTPSNIVGKIISFFTGSKYCHTEMFIGKTNYGLNWKYEAKEYRSLKAYLKLHKNVDAFRIPEKMYAFSEKEIDKMHAWWWTRIDTKADYGYINLLSFLWKMPYRKHCKKNGIPYKLKDIDKNNVCSAAVDKCLFIGGYNIFPDFPERCSYPSLFAKKLMKYKM